MTKEGGVALGFFLIGLMGLILIVELPVGTLNKPDVAFFPVIVSILLMGLALAAWAKAVRAKGKKAGFDLGEHWVRLIPTILVIVAYVVLLKPVGYLVCTFLAVVIFSKLVKCTWKSALLISLICTVVSFVALRFYLMSPIPRGIIPF
jgi:putative tricarboxylic transport membrane protein